MNEMGIEYGVAHMKMNEMRIAEINSHKYWINYETRMRLASSDRVGIAGNRNKE